MSAARVQGSREFITATSVMRRSEPHSAHRTRNCKRSYFGRRVWRSRSFEELAVCPSANKDDRSTRPCRVVYLIDQEEMAADMAFACASPFALERVVETFRTEGRIIGDRQVHGLFELSHVLAARLREALPVLAEGFGQIECTRQTRALMLLRHRDRPTVHLNRNSGHDVQRSSRLPLRWLLASLH